MHSIRQHDASITRMLRHPTTGQFFTASRDGTVGVWDAEIRPQDRLRPVTLASANMGAQQLRPAPTWLADIAFCGIEDQLLACCGFDNRIKMFHLLKAGRRPQQADGGYTMRSEDRPLVCETIHWRIAIKLCSSGCGLIKPTLLGKRHSRSRAGSGSGTWRASGGPTWRRATSSVSSPSSRSAKPAPPNLSRVTRVHAP
jgi:hypothetical protein